MDGFGGEEVVTTVRVINVPSHTTEAEFNCWFLFAEGFEQGQLKATRGYGVSQLGWARFCSVEAAQVAIERLNGRELSEDQSPEGVTLKADMAKQNFRPNPQGKKRPHSEMAMHMPAQMPQRMPMQQVAYTVPPAPQQPVWNAPQQPAWNRSGPSPGGQGVGGSTLVVGGLLPQCSEGELVDFFQTRFHGFVKLKFMPASGQKPGLCFIKFESVEHADATFHALGEGIDTLPSNPTVPLRPEWAKNDLDAPRDGGGATGGQYAGYAGYAGFAGYGGAPAPRARVMAPPPPAARQASWGGGGPVGQHAGQTPPGDTMFIGGLAANAPEAELQTALHGFPGFVRMKMCGGSHLPTAFALFDSVDSCTQAMSSLAGMALPSAPQQALNCEFARNSLDKRGR